MKRSPGRRRGAPQLQSVVKLRGTRLNTKRNFQLLRERFFAAFRQQRAHLLQHYLFTGSCLALGRPWLRDIERSAVWHRAELFSFSHITTYHRVPRPGPIPIPPHLPIISLPKRTIAPERSNLGHPLRRQTTNPRTGTGPRPKAHSVRYVPGPCRSLDPTPPPLLSQPHEHKHVTWGKAHFRPFQPSKQRTYRFPVFASFQKQSTYSEC
jgi:hypothetical protein